MLMVTHDLRLAASVAHAAFFLKDGAIVEPRSSHELFSCPRDARTALFVCTPTHTLLVLHA